MQTNKIAVAAACICVLAACATPYGPKSSSSTGGYTDKKIADGKYYIESLTNVPTGPEKAFEYWHRRAAELCNGKPYAHDAVLSNKRMTNYGGIPGYYTKHDWPLVVGTATCEVSEQSGEK